MKTLAFGVLAGYLYTAGALSAQAVREFTIMTVAGTGTPAFSGDSGAATAAEVRFPIGLAVDSGGNLFFADTLNQRIRKVSPDGTITTVAGNGTTGNGGDGGAATSATLNNPCGIAIDSAGNLYIADTRNHVVRRVTSSGTISRLAGIAEAGYSADGAAATSAALNTPLGVAVDSSGIVYVADTFNHRIRRIAADGVITTVVGNGSAGFAGDGGAASLAALNYPQGIAFDSGNNLYIADTFNHRIRKVSPDGIITTVAGNGFAGFSGDGRAAISSSLTYPKFAAPDASGNFVIVDSSNSRVRWVSEDGTITTVAGNGRFGDGGDGGPGTRALLRFPSHAAFGPGGRIYFSDTQNNRIRMLEPQQQASSLLTRPSIAEGGVAAKAAPGSWIEIYGSNLAVRTASGPDTPFYLDGTTVAIDGEPAAISYVSPNQVNVQVPASIQPGRRAIVVTTAAGLSNPYTITVEDR